MRPLYLLAIAFGVVCCSISASAKPYAYNDDYGNFSIQFPDRPVVKITNNFTDWISRCVSITLEDYTESGYSFTFEARDCYTKEGNIEHHSWEALGMLPEDRALLFFRYGPGRAVAGTRNLSAWATTKWWYIRTERTLYYVGVSGCTEKLGNYHVVSPKALESVAQRFWKGVAITR